MARSKFRFITVKPCEKLEIKSYLSLPPPSAAELQNEHIWKFDQKFVFLFRLKYPSFRCREPKSSSWGTGEFVVPLPVHQSNHTAMPYKAKSRRVTISGLSVVRVEVHLKDLCWICWIECYWSLSLFQWMTHTSGITTFVCKQTSRTNEFSQFKKHRSKAIC